MRHERLHGLTDGIFAIVMTLLVLELKVPDLGGTISNVELWRELVALWPVMLSFGLSFAVLYNYWRAHNFIISTLAKNLDVTVVGYNALFLFFVTLVPFSAYTLGRYWQTQLAITLFSLNSVAIGSLLLVMRGYILRQEDIEVSDHWTPTAHRYANIRTLMPMTAALLAIPISFFDVRWAMAVLSLAICFNFFDPAVELVNKLLGPVRQ